MFHDDDAYREFSDLTTLKVYSRHGTLVTTTDVDVVVRFSSQENTLHIYVTPHQEESDSPSLAKLNFGKKHIEK